MGSRSTIVRGIALALAVGGLVLGLALTTLAGAPGSAPGASGSRLDHSSPLRPLPALSPHEAPGRAAIFSASTPFVLETLGLCNGSALPGNLAAKCAGTSPSAATYVASLGVVFIADSSGCDLLPVSATTGLEGTPFFAGCRPMGVAYDPANGDLYVTNYGRFCCYGNVTVVNATTHALVGKVGLGFYPTGVLYDPTVNEVFAATYWNVTVINTTSNLFAGTAVTFGNGSQSLAYNTNLTWNPANDFIYATDGPNVTAFNASDLSYVGHDYVRGQLVGLALDPLNDQLFVTQRAYRQNPSDNVTVLNATSLAAVTTVPVCDVPYGIVYDPVIDRVYVSCVSSDAVESIDPSNDSVAGELVLGPPSGPSPHGDWPVALASVGGLVYALDAGTGAVSVISPGTGWYLASFTEAGVPAGVNWSVTLNGTTATSSASGLNFVVTNGSLTYSVANLTNYSASPDAGTVTTSGANTSTPVAFILNTYAVTFTAFGLPSGMMWSVNLAGHNNQSTTSTIGFQEPDGLYSFTVNPVPGYESTPSSGLVTVLLGPASVNVSFVPIGTPLYNVTFTESGLAPGTNWSVTFGNFSSRGNTSSLNFTVPNGTYAYAVDGIAGYQDQNATGTVHIAGANVTESIHFAPNAPATYDVTFQETGLTTGTNWSVTFNGSSVNSTARALAFSVGNGTFAYSISPVSGYNANRSSGTVQVAGASVALSVLFTPKPPVVVVLTFHETGLPSGTTWSVSVDGQEKSSKNTSLSIDLEQGSYAYTVESVHGYACNVSSSTVTLAGSNETVWLSYAPQGPGGGLPAGPTTAEWVALGVIIVIAVAIALVLSARAGRRGGTGADDGGGGSRAPEPSDEPQWPPGPPNEE